MSDDPQDGSANCEASPSSRLLETAIALKTGLPPQVQRSFWRAFNRVFAAAAEWPANYLEGKAKVAASRANVTVAEYNSQAADIESQQKARAIVNEKTANIAALAFVESSLTERAVEYHASHILKEQTRREEILQIASEVLRDSPPASDSEAEIDDDILETIFREGAQRSSEEFRLLFGRILAGEIKKPGTFSIGTLQSIGRLTPETAKIFQNLCNISTINVSNTGPLPAKVITDPFGDAGNNALIQFGLAYFQLANLVEAGLIRTGFYECLELTADSWDSPFGFEHGGSAFFLTKDQSEDAVVPAETLRLTGVTFSAAGQELRTVVPMVVNASYIAAFSKWLRGRGLLLHREERRHEGRVYGILVEPAA